MKGNVDIFQIFFFQLMIFQSELPTSPGSFKLPNISKIIERFIFIQFLTLWNLSSRNNCVAFGKAATHNTVFYSCLKIENQ